jgi:hypothetical protein
MKKGLILLGLLCMGSFVFAADIVADVTAADPGEENGAVDLLVTGGVGPYTYSWTGPDGFTSTDEDLVDIGSGIYVVTVTDQFCGVATLEIEVGIQNYSTLDEEADLAISIYPNPTQDRIYIQSDEPVQSEVFTAEGKKVSPLSWNQTIDLSNQAPGTYFVHIHTADAVLVKKVLLQ